MNHPDSFSTKAFLTINDQTYSYFSLPALAEKLDIDLAKMPVSIKILLENMLRNEDGKRVQQMHIDALSRWTPDLASKQEVPFMPARVLMQDFTGVPAVVDLAAMRDAVARLGADPELINPQIPVHLVIDHSVQIDQFGSTKSFEINSEKEFVRNRERYTFLKWGQKSFQNFSVVPPATGICHQVNLEYLASVVVNDTKNGRNILYPDTLVGLDSHTTMINGVGVFGWGVGGIEAEAVMLGQPYYMLIPQVVGFELTGRMPEGVTATDLVLTITKMMREKGVVGKFVEFFGEGLVRLTLADRATISNMTPEFGATMSLFPVDDEALNYLKFTGRSKDHVRIIKEYLMAQGLFWTPDMAKPEFTDTLHLDLNEVEPCLAGPRRPQDRIELSRIKKSFMKDLANIYSKGDCEAVRDEEWEGEGGAMVDAEKLTQQVVFRKPEDEDGISVKRPYLSFFLDHGSVVIAAITSCTNTSNPSVLLGAGLMAKKAVECGIQVRPWVKTSLAPGSKVVTDYLEAAGLMTYLKALRFHLVAYGCTTCIGNSGPLQSDVTQVVQDTDLVVASVLSGNRNFEGRINPLTRANYLASPMLVIAFALAGTVNINMEKEPLGHNPNNEPIFLKDIWPTEAEIKEAMTHLSPEMFSTQYGNAYEGDEHWQALPLTQSTIYPWDSSSTYIKEPPFFQKMTLDPPEQESIQEARVLALMGDSITTDHISPAGAIPADSPTDSYLADQGLAREDFNSYGSRRGNHEVMMRGTFGNMRLKNQLAPETEGGWTKNFLTGEIQSIYDAAMAYQKENIALVVIAGKEYGTGSSRDWAAKGTLLLGVRAVIAESFERIHRSNLVAMGVLPLQFLEGENAGSLGLTGEEMFEIQDLGNDVQPGQEIMVKAASSGDAKEFKAILRLDSVVEVEYYRHGGILPYVIRQMI